MNNSAAPKPHGGIPLAAGLILLWHVLAGATDWPQYRGPATDGTTPDPISANWPTGGPTVVWTNASLTNGFSSVVPHSRGGAVQVNGDFSNGNANGASSVDLGAIGGNRGNLDGSVNWLAIKKMKLHRGSQQYGPDGCWAMW